MYLKHIINIYFRQKNNNLFYSSLKTSLQQQQDGPAIQLATQPEYQSVLLMLNRLIIYHQINIQKRTWCFQTA